MNRQVKQQRRRLKKENKYLLEQIQEHFRAYGGL